MSLLHPWVLALWLLYPLCLVLCRRAQHTIAFGNLAMLKSVASGRGDRQKWILGLVLLLLLLALASPVRRHVQMQNSSKGYEIALLLDVSYSMRDDRRFDEAKKILETFIKKRSRDKLALEVFGDRAALAAPMSSDTKGLLRILHALYPGVAGGRETALYEALYRSVDLFDPDYRGEKFVILLTDGIDTASSVPLETARRRLKRAGVHLFTVGVGSDYRRRLLEDLSLANKGAFFAAKDPKELAAIYRIIDRQLKERLRSHATISQEPLYRWPLGAALLLMAWLLFAEPRRMRRIGYALATILVLTALILPLPGSKASQKNPPTLLILLDLSRSMQARDLPPNRLRWAQSRILDLLEHLPDARIGILGFARQAYLIAPPTRNRQALAWLIRHLPPAPEIKEGSDLAEALRQALAMLRGSQKAALLILSDGGDEMHPEAVLPPDKRRKIPIFAYATATAKGAPIPRRGGGWLEDPATGAVVVSRPNPALERLARISGGVFASANGWPSLRKRLAETLRSPTPKLQKQTRRASILIALAILLLLLSSFATIPRKWRQR